jgi:hypothetical protein
LAATCVGAGALGVAVALGCDAGAGPELSAIRSLTGSGGGGTGMRGLEFGAAATLVGSAGSDLGTLPGVGERGSISLRPVRRLLVFCDSVAREFVTPVVGVDSSVRLAMVVGWDSSSGGGGVGMRGFPEFATGTRRIPEGAAAVWDGDGAWGVRATDAEPPASRIGCGEPELLATGIPCFPLW